MKTSEAYELARKNEVENLREALDLMRRSYIALHNDLQVVDGPNPQVVEATEIFDRACEVEKMADKNARQQEALGDLVAGIVQAKKDELYELRAYARNDGAEHKMSAGRCADAVARLEGT